MSPDRRDDDDEWFSATRESLTGREVAPLFGPAMTRGRRLKRVTMGLCALGLVGALLTPAHPDRAAPDLRARGPGASRGQPLTSLAPCGHCFYFDPSIPWARVTLDGQPITAPQPGDPAPLTLSVGVHILAWQADPAPEQTCRVSVPAAPDDTCRLASFTIEYAAGHPPALVVLLAGDPSQVSPDQRGSVLSTMRHTLQQQEIMQSGQDQNG